MRIITFDIETANVFSDVGSSDPTALDISLVGIHDSETNEYDAFLVQDFGRLWTILEHADMLVGYNSDHFDIPLLNKYYPGDLSHIRSLDLLKEIHRVLGRRVKLDSVAEATLGVNKSGNGLQALEWWRKGEIDKVREYCLKDVEITRNIFDYALKHQAIKIKELGGVRDVRLDTRGWLKETSQPLTKTLGF